MKRLFLVAGEVSGDTHGARLMECLQEARPGELDLSGLGGGQMKSVSGAIEDWLDDAAVLGLWEVLKNYPYFRRKMEETVSAILSNSPDAVILIDYPGFNLRLAKRLRDGGYTKKIIYYISPQVWAWKKGRIPVMAKLLDLMICLFPFEKPLYEGSGLKTVFAGHPFVDELAQKKIGCERDPNLVALLPGSREREVEALFPAMVGAAKKMGHENPELRFVTAAVNERLAKRLREIADEARLRELEVNSMSIHEIMQRAQVGVVASGTATLQAAYFGLPYCLVYKVSWLTYVVGKMVVEVDFLGIVNILAGREVVKELLQGKVTADNIASELNELLNFKSERERLQAELADTVATLGEGGSHRNAAAAVLETLGFPDEERKQESDPLLT